MTNAWPEGSSIDNPTSWYTYVAVIDCVDNDPSDPENVLCSFAVTYCEENVPDSEGPYSRIYRRTVDASGPREGWELIGHTCHTPSVPARSGDGAQLTEAMLLEQFHRTEFAPPEISLQPPDSRTLVNLPVYFELVWPEEGHEPMEVDTTLLIGHEVRIRPTLSGATYHFGDGSAHGPTTSLGGPYPSGDVTHEYTSAATVSPHVTAVYGGEVSVDGSAWTTIPGTVTIDGPTQSLEVLTSRNRLYNQ